MVKKSVIPKSEQRKGICDPSPQHQAERMHKRGRHEDEEHEGRWDEATKGGEGVRKERESWRRGEIRWEEELDSEEEKMKLGVTDCGAEEQITLLG